MPSTYTSNRKAILAEMDRVIAREVERTGDDVLRLVQESYRSPKSGRVYRIGKTPTKGDRRAGRSFRSHRASAPGEAPAIDSSALSKGTARTDAVRVSDLRWLVTCGVTIQSGRGAPVSQGRSIAEILEFGGVRVEPRPAWRPALEVLRARRTNLKG